MSGTAPAGTSPAGTGHSTEDVQEPGLGGFFGSTIIDTARAIMATMAPASGTRSRGKTVLRALEGQVVNLRRNHAVLPVIDGSARADMLLKTDKGPKEDGTWDITDSDTEVALVSNVGGARHNFPADTPLVLDPAVPGIVGAPSPVLTAAMIDGTDSTAFATIQDMVLYEQLEGPVLSLDVVRSGLKKFPGVALTWQSFEPADGVSSSQRIREARTGRGSSLYSIIYTVHIISSRSESDNARRHQGLALVDLLARLLTDRNEVDGYPMSNPSGLQLRSGTRESGPQPEYKRFYIYRITLAAMQAFNQIDLRAPANDWLVTNLNTLIQQRPALPDQGDAPVVVDNKIPMG